MKRPASPTDWHRVQAAQFGRLPEVDLQAGLTGAEAERRQEAFGMNRISARRGTPARVKFLQPFNRPLVCILLAAPCGIGVARGEYAVAMFSAVVALAVGVPPLAPVHIPSVDLFPV